METVVLPNGRTLTLEKIAYGKVLEGGNPLHNRLAKLLPKWMKDKMGLKNPVKLHDGDPAVGVWLTFHGPAKEWPNNSKIAIGLDSDEGGRLESHIRRTELSPNETQIAVAFPIFPRRGGKLKVTLYQSKSGWKAPKAAEFVFDSPVNETFPVWKAEPFPVVRRTNNLEIELTRLAFGLGNELKFRAAKEDERTKSGALFKIREDGEPTKRWIPDGVRMSDATGNERSQSSWGGQWQKDLYHFQWSPALWRDTGGMRFKFEMTRNPKAGFATNELLVIKGVRVPTGTNVTQLNIETNRLGHTIRIVALLGAKGKIKTAARMRSASSEPELFVEASPPLLDKQLDLISVVDDQGREGRSSGASWSRPQGTYDLSLDFHNEAKTLDLTLAVHRSHYVEFVVEPEILKPVPKPVK